MWECEKCGHKSGTRRTSSHGCDHKWWDEYELANAREMWKQKQKAENERELLAFNHELLNTELGQKLLSGEEGWSWLLTDSREKGRRWLNSPFGTNWLSSESGKAYLNNVVHENVLIACKSKGVNEIDVFIKEIESNYIFEEYGLAPYIGIDYLKTEQGKLYTANLVNELKVLLKKKKDEKIGCGCLVLIIYFSSITYFIVKYHENQNMAVPAVIMLLLPVVAFFIALLKKGWRIFAPFIAVMFIISIIIIRKFNLG